MWNYKDKQIKSHDDLPYNCTHIIYCIYYTDNTKYIGYKTVRTTKELPLLLNGKERPNRVDTKNRNKNGKRVTMEVVSVDKPFVNYEGSSEENKGKTISHKEILLMTSSKRTATYLEVRELMRAGAIEPDTEYNNKNINRLWFDNCLEGLIND